VTEDANRRSLCQRFATNQAGFTSFVRTRITSAIESWKVGPPDLKVGLPDEAQVERSRFAIGERKRCGVSSKRLEELGVGRRVDVRPLQGDRVELAGWKPTDDELSRGVGPGGREVS